MSKSTTCRVLKKAEYDGRVEWWNFFISEVNRQKRLQFAKYHVNEDPGFSNKIIFTVDSKFTVFGSDGRKIVCGVSQIPSFNQNICVHYSSTEMETLILDCISAAGVGKLHFIKVSMDHRMYINILK